MSPGAAQDLLFSGQFAARVEGSALSALTSFTGLDHLLSRNDGRVPAWLQLIESLPRWQPSGVELLDAVRIGSAGDINEQEQEELREALRALIPWRKGPFELFGIDIDTEWRSDMKWDRLRDHIAPLDGRTVLDVGCGSAYHCFRMLGAGAGLVIGLEPHLPYFVQFALLRRFVPQLPVFVLPIPMEKVPADLGCFDSVFSMGVLYHRRSPLDHLMELRAALRKGGELVLETLVVEGPAGYSLMPEKRYSRMSNVWFLPSCATTELWLRRCGFSNIRLIDLSTTTSAEQRATPWMPFQSLSDGLDPADNSRTIEGLPAPLRAVFIATAA